MNYLVLLPIIRLPIFREPGSRPSRAAFRTLLNWSYSYSYEVKKQAAPPRPQLQHNSIATAHYLIN